MLNGKFNDSDLLRREQVLIVDDNYGATLVQTWENHKTGELIQVHEESGFYRVRPAPSAEEEFPEYGNWYKT